ncbi:MAG: hypothetical protein ACRDDZ_11220 [Marinifilaceae bacterium]
MEKELLKTVLANLSTLPGIYVGEDWGQLNFDKPPVSFPCALIDIDSVDYSNLAQGKQHANAVFNVTVADMFAHHIAHGMQDKHLNNELKIYDTLKAVNKILHNKSIPGYGTIIRVRMDKTKREDDIREFVISYRIYYDDSSCVNNRTYTKPQAQIDII